MASVALGKTDAVPVAVTKLRAQEIRGLIASGRCPHYEEQQRLRLEAAPRPPTVGQAIDIHLERLLRDLKHPDHRIRQLKQDLKSLFGRPDQRCYATRMGRTVGKSRQACALCNQSTAGGCISYVQRLVRPDQATCSYDGQQRTSQMSIKPLNHLRMNTEKPHHRSH